MRRNLRLEAFEDIEVGEVGLGLVEVIGVGAAPAEGFALGVLDSTDVDAAVFEEPLLRGTEVFADDSYDANIGEVTGRQRKIGGSTSKNVFDAD